MVPLLPKLSPATGGDPVVLATQRWIERVVIGLNLCPFARAVHAAGRIRYRVSRAADVVSLERDLVSELRWLDDVKTERCETTMLIHPHVLADFLDYNDFLAVADDVVAASGFTGVVQIASFHPRYRFAGTRDDDMANRSNRSPYPMLQLLREESVEQALKAFPDPATIYERNIDMLRTLGPAGWRRLFDSDR